MHCREEEEMHQDCGVVQDNVSVVDNNISTRLGNNGLKRKVVWLNRDGIFFFFSATVDTTPQGSGNLYVASHHPLL